MEELRSFVLILMLVIASTNATLVVSSPDSMNIVIDKDTTMLCDLPDVNWDTRPPPENQRLMVGSPPGLGPRRSVLNFSVSDIPPGSTIHSATLNLYLESSDTAPFTAIVNAHQIYNYWEEQKATWNLRNRYSWHILPWDHPGGDYYAAVLGSTSFSIPCPVPGMCSIDLTNFVQRLVNKEIGDFHGILIEADSSSKWISFWSSDGPPDKKPFLHLEYTLATIELTPATIEESVVQGEVATYQVVIGGTYKGNADVDVNWIAPAPTGATITTDKSGGVPPFTLTITVQTSSTTPPGDYSFLVEVRGTEGSPALSPSESITLGLHVGEAIAPDFTLSVSPSSRIISSGGSVDFLIDLTSVGGFSSPVSLSVSGLPSGASHSFSANNQVPDFSSTLSISVPSGTPVRTYSITISASGGGITHQQTVTLEVTEAPRFTIRVEPDFRTVNQGGSAQYSVHVTGVGGFSDPVTLGIIGLPPGATPTVTVNSRPPSFDTILTIVVGSDTPTGTYTMYVQGSGGGLTINSNPFTLTVTTPSGPTPTPSPTPTPGEFDFEISVDPKNLPLPVSGSGTVIIELILTSGTGQQVTLSATGFPPDSTYSFSPETLTPPGSSTLYIKAGTTPGTYTILMRATGGGIERSAKLILVVEAPRKCVIATATYGSELSPKVQVLRSFRDEVVMSSFAGRQFMKAFNRFYYGWSTPIAMFLEEHDSIRGLFKVLLYPLIEILDAVNRVYRILSFNTEVGVIFSGILASSLIGIVYLSPLVYFVAKKGLLNFEYKWLLSPALIGLSLLAISELLLIGGLASLASSILVISLMLSAPILLSLLLIRLKH